MKIDLYAPNRQAEWDAFVRASKNGTFLLSRDYMDYHEDRFRDHSLVVYDDEGRLLGLVPAHVEGTRLMSHGGLTYGGLVIGADMKIPIVLGIFEEIATFLRERGFREWFYKTVPHIYHRLPAEEDRYALFLAGAILSRRDVLTVVDSRERLPYQQRRQRALQKARKNGLVAAEDNRLQEFWPIVEANLQERFGVPPVHTLAEIGLLRTRFPQQIRLFTCRNGDRPVGGVLIYESCRVAHVQYIGSTEEGRCLGALDLVFDYLLTDVYAGKPYFDFGISNEDAGRRLNRGLIDQKEGFGARAIAHDHYTIDLAGWEPGRLGRALQ